MFFTFRLTMFNFQGTSPTARGGQLYYYFTLNSVCHELFSSFFKFRFADIVFAVLLDPVLQELCCFRSSLAPCVSRDSLHNIASFFAFVNTIFHFFLNYFLGHYILCSKVQIISICQEMVYQVEENENL